MGCASSQWRSSHAHARPVGRYQQLEWSKHAGGPVEGGRLLTHACTERGVRASPAESTREAVSGMAAVATSACACGAIGGAPWINCHLQLLHRRCRTTEERAVQHSSAPGLVAGRLTSCSMPILVPSTVSASATICTVNQRRDATRLWAAASVEGVQR